MPAPAATLLAGAELLLLALGALVIGEALRRVLRLRTGLDGNGGVVERALVSFFLGGAALYVVAWIPVPATGPLTLPILAVLAAAGLLADFWRRTGRLPRRGDLAALRPSGPAAVALAAALALFVVELFSLASTPSGNTWDASVLALYSSELATHGHLVLALAPNGPGFVSYPQGVVVWQAVLAVAPGAEPLRVALDVDALFIALAPLGGYVVGRRWLSSDRAGAAVAVGFLLLGSWTRILVSGSYDFVAAFPLGLALAGWARPVFHEPGATRSETLLWGSLAGYSAALNPVPAEWLFLGVALTVILGRRSPNVARQATLERWAVALGAGALWIVPNLVGLVLDGGVPVTGFGPPSIAVVNPLALGTFVGAIDPFLFGPGYNLLSTFAALRVELAALLLVALLLPFVPTLNQRGNRSVRPFYRWSIAMALAAVLVILTSQLAAAGVPAIRSLGPLTSAGEASILLFTVYTIVAFVPLTMLVEVLGPRPRDRSVDGSSTPSAPVRHRPGSTERARLFAVVGCALLLAPGAAVLATDFPPTVRTISTAVGNLTGADLDLLTWAGRHVPDGDRVLVAPGGALQFLPSYQPRAIVVFTMVGGASSNVSYSLVSFELENGILDLPGRAAIADLGVAYIAVTQANTVLWPPYLPGPLLADPAGFPVVYHAGDAFLFAVA